MREHGLWEAASLPRHQENTASRSHIIRLHGPWRCELCKSPAALPRTNPEASPGGSTEILTIKLPVDWSTFSCEPTFDSMVWRRSFGRPTNLGHRERVELVISNLRTDVVVWLNEVQIEPIARTDLMARFEVTNLMQDRSELALEVRTPSPESQTAHSIGESNELTAAGPFGQVYLEIRTSEGPDECRLSQ